MVAPLVGAVIVPLASAILGGLASRSRSPLQYAQLSQRGFEKIMEPTLESTSRPRPEEQPSPHQEAQKNANEIVVEPQKQYTPQGAAGKDFIQEVAQPPPIPQTNVPLAPPIQTGDVTLEQTAPASLQPSEEPPLSLQPSYLSSSQMTSPMKPPRGNVYGPQASDIDAQMKARTTNVTQFSQPPQQNSGKMTGLELAMLGATLASGMFQTRPGPAPPGLPGGGGINMQPVFWRR